MARVDALLPAKIGASTRFSDADRDRSQAQKVEWLTIGSPLTVFLWPQVQTIQIGMLPIAIDCGDQLRKSHADGELQGLSGRSGLSPNPRWDCQNLP